MPKAEVGSTKYLNNKLKSKGLQRLRWYCQVCEKQNRDENGFKCHVQSESHVRKIQAIGLEGSQRVISDYSKDFQRDFIQLLRTSHNTKPVHINHFYQQYIADKNHIHMNATRWPSLTEFAKHLGREGICRVEDNEKGLHIAWIDSSPEALRRQEAIRKKERQDKGDEEREQQQIKAQIQKAEAEAEVKAQLDEDQEARYHKSEEVTKITLNLGARTTETKPTASAALMDEDVQGTEKEEQEVSKSISPSTGVHESHPEKVSLKVGAISKPKNVFAGVSKKNALGGKGTAKEVPKRPMCEAERIMMAEIEQKRLREAGKGLNSPHKRPRLA